jgi:hypothetical protein
MIYLGLLRKLLWAGNRYLQRIILSARMLVGGRTMRHILPLDAYVANPRLLVSLILSVNEVLVDDRRPTVASPDLDAKLMGIPPDNVWRGCYVPLALHTTIMAGVRMKERLERAASVRASTDRSLYRL